jgi:hypothetical protein
MRDDSHFMKERRWEQMATADKLAKIIIRDVPVGQLAELVSDKAVSKKPKPGGRFCGAGCSGAGCGSWCGLACESTAGAFGVIDPEGKSGLTLDELKRLTQDMPALRARVVANLDLTARKFKRTYKL